MAEKKISIRNLYPGHSDEWYQEAKANLRRYLNILVDISASRLKAESNETDEE